MRPTVEDVGRRVVVRHRLADGRATDVVGELLALGDHGVRVRAADGGEVAVAARDVVAARVVEPARTGRHPSATVAAGAVLRTDAVPRAGVAATPVGVAARRTALGWAAPAEAALGAWRLRSGTGRMLRSSSALALGDPGLPLDAALVAVAEHYRALDLRPAVQVSSRTDGGSARGDDADEEAAGALERALAAGGWLPRAWTVLALRPVAVVAAPDRGAAAATVRVSPSPGAGWLAASDHHGSPLARADLPPERDGVAVAYAGVPAPQRGGPVDPAPLVAVGRGALARRWLGITCVVVEPAHRRRGLAGAVVGALLDHLGGPATVDALYVQVVGTNAAARATWRAQGFVDHSRYRFWTLPAPG